MKTLNVVATIEHKHEGLPRFVCIPMKTVKPWKLSGTTTVELTINDVYLGRRSLKRWDGSGHTDSLQRYDRCFNLAPLSPINA